jgi:GT2 family glycosyltransferase
MNHHFTSQIAILILFYNKVDQTIECVNSFLLSQQIIYVLNNGSEKKQWDLLKNKYKNNNQVQLLDAGNNLGISGGRNYLINASSEQWLFSIDNDITIKPEKEWVHLFNKYIIENKDVKIISPIIYNVHDEQWSQQLNLKINGNIVGIEQGKYETTNCFPGGASIIHRSVFEIYGLYDNAMFVGFEDYEFALRALLSEQGQLKVNHIGFIQLIHEHRVQKTNANKNAIRQRYDANKLRVSYNHLMSKHNIHFEHDWKCWTDKQLEEMTSPKLWLRMKRILKRFFNL